MHLIVLLLLLSVVHAYPGYICSSYKPDLCFGVSSSSGNIEELDAVQLKNLPNVLSDKARDGMALDQMRWEYNETSGALQVVRPVNTSEFFMSSIRAHVIVRSDPTTFFIVPVIVNGTMIENRGQLITYGPKCIYIARCDSKLADGETVFHCDKDEDRPATAFADIRKGSYIKIKECSLTVLQAPMARDFIFKETCAEGCTSEALFNDECDEVCNVPACSFDRHNCYNETLSPTFAPTRSPTTTDATSSPTTNPSLSPTFAPTLGPIHSILTTTDNPSLAPTKKPTQMTTPLTSKPTTKHPTYPECPKFPDVVTKEDLEKMRKEFLIWQRLVDDATKTLEDVLKEISIQLRSVMTYLFVLLALLILSCLMGAAVLGIKLWYLPDTKQHHT